MPLMFSIVPIHAQVPGMMFNSLVLKTFMAKKYVQFSTKTMSPEENITLESRERPCVAPAVTTRFDLQ